jgi:hypothetical protein
MREIAQFEFENWCAACQRAKAQLTAFSDTPIDSSKPSSAIQDGYPSRSTLDYSLRRFCMPLPPTVNLGNPQLGPTIFCKSGIFRFSDDSRCLLNSAAEKRVVHSPLNFAVLQSSLKKNLEMNSESVGTSENIYSLAEYRLAVTEEDLELAKFWFAWACLRPRAVIRDSSYSYKRPRLNDGSFAAFLEWRWAQTSLPARLYRVDFSYEDHDANRAIQLARRVDPGVMEAAMDSNPEQLARTLKEWQQQAVKDLRHFTKALEVAPLMRLFAASWIVSTRTFATEASFSVATASRILNSLDSVGVLRRGMVRGHAVYSLTESHLRAMNLAEELRPGLPKVIGLKFA